MIAERARPGAGRSPLRRLVHALRYRQLTVTDVARPTPRVMRATLAGAELEGFLTPGFDDSVRVFLPSTDAAPPIARDFTPHGFDPTRHELRVDFALHAGGPAARWAARAAPGDRLIIGGPRVSSLVSTDFAWHLLIGDESALPAIRRRLAELPGEARALVFIEVHDAAEVQELQSAADLRVRWLPRTRHAESGAALYDAVARLRRPAGDFHAWIAGESETARALRTLVLDRHRADPACLSATGYWRRDAVAAHDPRR